MDMCTNTWIELGVPRESKELIQITEAGTSVFRLVDGSAVSQWSMNRPERTGTPDFDISELFAYGAVSIRLIHRFQNGGDACLKTRFQNGLRALNQMQVILEGGSIV